MVRSSACKSRCLKTIENTPKDWHRQITMLFQFQNVSEWASMGHPWASHPIISSTRETSGKATSSTYQQQLAYLEVLEPLHFFVPYCRGFRTHCGTLALTSKLVQDPSRYQIHSNLGAILSTARDGLRSRKQIPRNTHLRMSEGCA